MEYCRIDTFLHVKITVVPLTCENKLALLLFYLSGKDRKRER